MNRSSLPLSCFIAALCLALPVAQAQAPTQPPAQTQDRGSVVLIAHPGMTTIDTQTAQRLFSGRAVEVAGVVVVPVHLAPGSKARERFMAQVMAMDEDKYVAYWTVRKHIGKGTPPRELKTAAEVMDFVQNTPGALGYVTAAELRPGLNVVLRP
jgi:ABC-type phosphate transport system substrate-binding protein